MGFLIAGITIVAVRWRILAKNVSHGKYACAQSDQAQGAGVCAAQLRKNGPRDD